MTEEPKRPENLRWLQEPTAPGQIKIHIDIGEGTTLTPEFSKALDALMKELHGEGPQGRTEPTAAKIDCSFLRNCGDVTCDPLNNCRPLHARPCLRQVSCGIAS